MLKKGLTLSGVISALLFTWAMTSSMLKFYAVNMSFVFTVIISLAVLSSVIMVFYNRATLLSFSVLIAITLILYAFFNEDWNPYIADFFTFASNILTHGENTTIGGRYFVALFFCYLAAIPSLFLFGKLRGAFWLGLLAGIVMFVLGQFGIRDTFPEICAITGAILCVSAGSFARKQVTSNKASNNIALRVLPIGVAIAILLSVVTPENAYNLHNIGIETFIDDFVDFFSINVDLGFSRTRTDFSIGEFGYKSERLGGPVSLSTEELFSVFTSSPTLLRASIKDVYTGYSWEDSTEDAQMRFDSPLVEDIKNRVFNETIPEIGEGESANQFYSSRSLTITSLAPQWRSELLHSGRPFTISGGNISEFVIYFDTQGEIFSKRPLYQGHNYMINERQLNFTKYSFAESVIGFETSIKALKDGGQIPDDQYTEMVERYTSLPSDISQEVYDFAALTEDAATPYLKILNIRERLAQQSTYTLTPEPVPEDQEFVSWFLETKQGYCTYYATAMTVLARTLGIPARYVEGFSMFGLQRDAKGNYIITGEQAHAWCEVYLEGIGWIPVDATLAYESGGSMNDQLPVPDTMPLVPTEDNMPYEKSESDDEEAIEEQELGGVRLDLVLYTLGGVVLLIILITLLILFVLNRPFRARQSRTAHKKLLLIYWRDILKMLPKLGMKPLIGETPTKLSDRASWIIFSEHAGFNDVSRIVEDCVYGSVEPDDEALLRVWGFHRDMDRELMKLLLPPRYIAARISWHHESSTIQMEL